MCEFVTFFLPWSSWLLYLSIMCLPLLAAVAAHITFLDDHKISNNFVRSTSFTFDILVSLIFLHLFFFSFFFLFSVSSGTARFLFWKMVKKPHCYAAVVIFLTISLQACAEDLQCKPVQSVYGTMLRGHIFQEHNAANIMACSLLCNSDIRCQSINYVISRYLCELNNRTKEARPEDSPSYNATHCRIHYAHFRHLFPGHHGSKQLLCKFRPYKRAV